MRIIVLAKHALACENLLDKYEVGFEIEQGICVINLRQLKMYFRGGRVGGRLGRQAFWLLDDKELEPHCLSGWETCGL